MTTTVIKIGNSNGMIIPSKLLKSLALSERDELEIYECNGGIFLKKSGANQVVTPFSALDNWSESNGFDEGFSLESALSYIEEIRQGRRNKEEVVL